MDTLTEFVISWSKFRNQGGPPPESLDGEKAVAVRSRSVRSLSGLAASLAAPSPPAMLANEDCKCREVDRFSVQHKRAREKV